MYPLGFHFRVVFKGLDDKEEKDTAFQSVSGLEAFIFREQPDQQERSHKQKVRTIYSPLVLKRAFKSYTECAFARWLYAHFNKTHEKPLAEAYIELLNDRHEPYMKWTVRNIVPQSWKLSEMNAERSEILTETIELHYEELIFQSLSNSQ